MKISVYNQNAEVVGEIELNDKIFAIKPTLHLLAEAVRIQASNARKGLANTKTRGEVSGGGKKPWKQKGTGRARFGSSRVPIWRGGGITFGPTGNENYTKKLNIKAKRKAIRQALSLASDSNKIIVVETYTAMDGKTKDMVKFLDKVGAKGRVLCVVSKKDDSKEKAVHNIPNVSISSATYLNVYDVLNADTIIISKKSLEIISDWLGGEK